MIGLCRKSNSERRALSFDYPVWLPACLQSLLVAPDKARRGEHNEV